VLHDNILPATTHFTEFVDTAAAASGKQRHEVLVLQLLDFNRHGCLDKKALESQTMETAVLNKMFGKRAATFVLVPDLPRSSSPLGLIDDVKELEKHFMDAQQHVDTRYTMPFEIDPRQMSRFSHQLVTHGRVAVQATTFENNLWLASSAVCTYGRPLTKDFPTLPRQTDLKRVESLQKTPTS
jgi:hypothetical protein